MADKSDFTENQEGSSPNDDFVKLDAYSTNEFEQVSGANAGGPYGDPQIEEITTTSGNAGQEDIGDHFGVGASEAEALARLDDELIAFGENESSPASNVVGSLSDLPESNDPLINFRGGSVSPSAPPSDSKLPQGLSSHSKGHDYSQIIKDFDSLSSVSESISEKSGIPETKPSSESKGIGSWLKGVDPRVKDLIYWRDIKKTGAVFGSMLAILLSLAVCSFLSVFAYLSLAVLTVTFSFTVYKKTMAAVQKNDEGHPFKSLLEMDLTLKEEKLRSVISNLLTNINNSVSELRRLFLVEDIVDSVKFGLLLWVFTYIGSWFNGMTLIILALISLFTLPKVYETYKVQIDSYVGLVKGHLSNAVNIVTSKVPFLKKREKAE